MAARIINGVTLHTAFRLPVSHNRKCDGGYIPLSASYLDEFRKCLFELETLVIDEISMVSQKVLEQVHKRLRDTF